MKTPGLFYREKSLFGLDIGHSNIKVMEIDRTLKDKPKITGYGVADYPAESITNGEITNFTTLSKSLYDLFNDHIVGTITTQRVACSVPTSRTFSRPMKLPVVEEKDIADAVHLEAEQYIPVAPANLYIDYEITSRDDSGIELLMVAIPKNVVDSYVKLLEGVGLEVAALEPTMSASSRLFGAADPSHNEPSILIDFGSVSIDIAVFDQTMFVNSTVPGGSDSITSIIAKQMGVSLEEAYTIKNRDGIMAGERQEQMVAAVGPFLDNLVREIKKIERYYNDHRGAGQRKLVQIVTIGGGANMPGLSEHLSEQLNLSARRLDPWKKISFGELQPPNETDRPMYITVAGSAILNPEEIYND